VEKQFKQINWKGEKEEVESFRNMDFSAFEPKQIADEVKTMIEFSKEKSNAEQTPALTDFNVLLTGASVKEVLSYYVGHSNVQNVYNGISTFKIEETMQGENIIGDKVSITLDPMLANSSHSKPFDTDGLPLKKVEILKDGLLKNYWGSSRFAHYLDIKPAGNIRNILVDKGSKSIDEMKSSPYLELLEFSDFQMNVLTGDFAGEIRLGLYFDGESVKPVTSGSISGNIKSVQEHMYLSKEIYQDNNYLGPKTLQLPKLNVNGK